MNDCMPPKDKWLLVDLLNNTTQSRILVVLLLPETICENFFLQRKLTCLFLW